MTGPDRPILCCSVLQTQRYVRMYNLAEQTLLKTLTPGTRWISSMDVHPSGDHLIVGGYDKKLCWFDLELSDKPYKILRFVTRRLSDFLCRVSWPRLLFPWRSVF